MDFVRFDGVESETINGSQDLICGRPGPLLDDAGRTFLYSGQVIGSEVPGEAAQFEREERLMVSHDGIDVWQYSRFQVGMNSVPFMIHDLARLMPL
jgi:hypothetical protein